jgi:Ca-activated chloride channel family protein
MKKLILAILCLHVISVSASEYDLQRYNNYKYHNESNERILFILDFSNSMSEYLEGQTKAEMMVETVKNILPAINPNTQVGLRVYGHRMGFTPFEACHASSLLVPISQLNSGAIYGALAKTQPKGMTPITYSLKQAIRYDFLGFSGKKHIILLTDGGENCDESPCKFVMELVRTRKDIKIDVIAFNVSYADDIDQLKCTSLVTSGKFYTANTAAELANSLRNTVQGYKKVEAKIVP